MRAAAARVLSAVALFCTDTFLDDHARDVEAAAPGLDIVPLRDGREVSEADIEAMVDAIEDELSGRDQIPSRELGEMVMGQLRDRDYVAYVRFASVYRNFQDIDEFVEELEDLSEARARLEQKKNQAELPL